MKYNISNLDQFKNKPIINTFNELINKVAAQGTELTDNKIKDLIKPYANTNCFNYINIMRGLNRKGYKLECFVKEDKKEYRITYMPTGEHDYFIIADSKTEIDGFNISSTSYISDIIRGIKQ